MSLTDVNGTYFTTANATCDPIGLNLVRDPNPDIAGIGVILAFFIPAYVTLIFVIGAYFAGLINDELLNIADRRFFKVRDRALSKTGARWTRWAGGLQAGVLAFSDTQLVFGIGMLITGFFELQYISIYHIQMVTYLAWMSSNVHLTTLTVLRQYFLQNKVLRYIRVTGMVILAALLVVALVPTSSSKAKQILLGDLTKPGGSYGFNAPARCFFTPNEGLAGATDPDAPWSFIILVVSYMWKIGSLFSTSHSAFLHYVRALPLSVMERALTRSMQADANSPTGKRGMAAFLRRQRYNALLVVYAWLVMVFDFSSSFAASLYFLTLSLAWGSVQVLVPRFAFNSSMDYDADENAWGFGQVLPLLLLLVPVFTVTEHFYGHTDEDRAPPVTRTPTYEPDYYTNIEKDAASVHTRGFSRRTTTDIAKIDVTSTAYSPTRSNTSPRSPPSALLTRAPPTHSDLEAARGPTPPPKPSATRTNDEPLDRNHTISEFFAKSHLTAEERVTLHSLFYRSRLFKSVLAWLNAGTVALVAELVSLVIRGNSSGVLWQAALGIGGGVPLTMLLFLALGIVLRSRLFKVHML